MEDGAENVPRYSWTGRSDDHSSSHRFEEQVSSCCTIQLGHEQAVPQGERRQLPRRCLCEPSLLARDAEYVLLLKL